MSARDRLFDVVPDLRYVEALRGNMRGLREKLAAQLADCDRQLQRLDAIAYALRELADDPPTAAVAAELAEDGWTGTGGQLVDCAYAVLSPKAPS